MTPKLIFFNNAKLLEGPCWDAKNNLLYFVSIRGNTIFALNPDTGRVNSYATDGAVGCAVICADGNILEAEKDGIFRINPTTFEKNYVAHAYTDIRMRYNDGKLDPVGRFLVGTMGDSERMEGHGKLYSMEADGTIKIIEENTTTSNGIGFSPDNTQMYFIDTPQRKVWAYDYDLSTGNASNRRTLIDFDITCEPGNPDGMCVAPDGSLYVAEWGGSRVAHFDAASGKKLGEILFPCKNVTSCCFGGENMEKLFVTTANDGESPLGGGLFVVDF